MIKGQNADRAAGRAVRRHSVASKETLRRFKRARMNYENEAHAQVLNLKTLHGQVKGVQSSMASLAEAVDEITAIGAQKLKKFGILEDICPKGVPTQTVNMTPQAHPLRPKPRLSPPSVPNSTGTVSFEVLYCISVG